jgi:2-methylcitrate dehydratase
VQTLLRKVRVTPAADLSERFPRELPCRLTVHLAGGRRLCAEKRDYEGFTTRPPNWESARKKFDRLSEPHATPTLRNRIAAMVESMEKAPVRGLMSLLRQAEAPALQQEVLQYGGT